MLTAQKAQEQLASFKVNNWKQKRIEAMTVLPIGLKEIGLAIVGEWTKSSIQVFLKKDKNLESDVNKILEENDAIKLYAITYQIRNIAVDRLNKLDSSERSQIFTVLFPRFPQQVEKAWQLFDQLPYQVGYQRRSFRVNEHSEIYNVARSQWLLILLSIVDGYEQDLPWFAAWATYLSYSGEALGILFAAAIDIDDAVGKEVFNILVDSAKGEHDTGLMGRHVTRGLLVASRPDGWEFIESLLLAAQRQEGLRQVILETIDEAHPEAFKRILRLIVDKDLTRFSSVIRAADVWFGIGWESVNSKVVKEALATVLSFLENPETLQSIVKIQSENLVETRHGASLQNVGVASLPNAETLYLALWSLGFQDAITAIPVAANFLEHPSVEYRFAAVYFLNQLRLPETQDTLLSALEDEDLRIATFAMRGLSQLMGTPQAIDLFDSLERLLTRFPEKPKVLPSLVWDWIKIETSQAEAASVLYNSLGDRSPKCLIPYLFLVNPYQRRDLAEKLAKIQPWDEEIRNTLFSLVGDNSRWVREQVIEILDKYQITNEEAILLEALLTRKSGDLRRGILGLLLNRVDEDVLASAQRLLDSKNSLQRQAGLELCRELKTQKRTVEECLDLVQTYQTQRKTLTETEANIIEIISEVERKEATLQDALGLFDLTQLTPIQSPTVQKKWPFVSTAAKECLLSLDKLIEQHSQTPVTITTWQGEQEELFGNVTYQFPHFNSEKTVEENLETLPLREVWENWYENRGKKLKDTDGLELVRAIVSLFSREFDSNVLEQLGFQTNQEKWWQNAQKSLFTKLDKQLQYPQIIQQLLIWFLHLHTPKDITAFLLDGVATTLTLIPFTQMTNEQIYMHYWQIESTLLGWFNFTRNHRFNFGSQWTAEHHIRYWHLVRALDRSLPYPKIAFEDVLMAYSCNGATEADLLAYILAEQNQNDFSRNNFHDLYTITGRKLPSNLAQYPILKDLGDRCRQRILEIELQRGDLPTAASQPALELQSVPGIATTLKLLQALGKDKFIRGYIYDSKSKSAVFSRLVQVSFPDENETPEDFAQQVQSTQISQQRLIEFAFYAPQWANYIEKALNWKNFSEAVWWIHTHTKDNQWQVPQEIRETWAAQSSERTPLSAQSLIDGAVDVAWFFRVYKSLDPEKWQQLDEAAKYASGGIGHKRAQLFADAMLGRVDKDSLINRITEKRHQDSVRSLGLLPLAKGKQKEKDLLNRYRILQEFIRTSRQFGSQRQASEKLAATIGLENLARTAGYADPQRLEWAMEAKAIADLVHRPATVKVEDVSVALSLSADGVPSISVTKNGKALKSVPAKLNKDPQITELKTRKQNITRQASRMRLSLEEAMIRGDQFTAAELEQLCSHPILKPMLEQLVFVGENEIGYPVEQGTTLKAHNGEIITITSQFLQIAHPSELLETQEWHLWQEDCFNQQRTQPFKQVFRELYLLTAAEKKEEKFSRRYEGHQVNSKQAFALLGQRGWVNYPDEGVKKTFHQANISVSISFNYGFSTPLEVEGLTLDTVYFTRRGEWTPLSLTEIPPRLFSEVMRDLDLVVSVAHQGGVDPEASHSTIEMRSALLRETCRLLKYDNVEIQGSHVLIAGQLNKYSVHLGSAVVHRQPGGFVCIVAVPSQHRGRIFLPFADNDPKTAEVLSKVILLAKDKEIKDPSILEQILS